MIIPFGILLIMVVYLIYSRNKFEQNVLKLYEEKFENWKDKNQEEKTQPKGAKQLVGLVFKTDYKLSIEVFDTNIQQSLKNSKFDIKQIQTKANDE